MPYIILFYFYKKRNPIVKLIKHFVQQPIDGTLYFSNVFCKFKKRMLPLE
jgi:hypothetical protein